jgi:hypothetical protein
MGALSSPVVTFAERSGPRLGVGLSLGLSPFRAFSVEVPLLSTQSSGALYESRNEVMISLIFFSPVSKVLVIVYRHGYLY